MTEWIGKFSSSNFVPHGYCLQWEPGLLWLHLLSDLAIALAYFSIPVALFGVARSERWAPYSRMLLLFGAFIFACGATHLMGIWTLWNATYLAEGVLKALTAAVSVSAAVALLRFGPKVSTLKTPAEVQAAFVTIEVEKLERTRAERALAEGEMLLQSLLDHAPASIFVKGVDGRFLLANQHFARDVGASHPSELVGRTAFDFNQREEAERCERIDKEVLRTGEPSVQPEERRRLLHRPGSEIWAHTTKAPWRDANGEILGIVGVSVEVTAQRQTQAELARLASIVQSANVAIIGADLAGTIQTWNRGAETLFDRAAAEMVGRNLAELEAPSSSGGFRDTITRVRSGERVETAEVLRIRSGGEVRQVSETVSAVIGPAGEVSGVSVIASDVTDQVAVERALRVTETHLSAILENTAAAIFVKTLDGRYVMSNPAHAAMCGLPAEEVLGKTDFELTAGEIAEARQAMDRRASSSRSAIHHEEDVAVQGEPRSYHIVETPLWDADGRLYGVCGIATDITERKQAEEVRRLNQQLLEANRDLADQHRDIERLRRVQDEFLAGLSHELRTPLNAIVGFSDLLSKEIAGPLSEKQRGFVQRVRDGGAHLVRLIDNVLDAAKTEAGGLQVRSETFMLMPLIEEVVSVMEPLAARRGIHVSTAGAESIAAVADPLRTRQILYNLASNAIKFGRPGGRVWIEAAAVGREIQVTVSDDGVGIDAADHGIVFERFRQAEPTAEGAGLGLFISKMLVERMGGAISVASRRDAGACFTFTLPADSGSPAVLAMTDRQPDTKTRDASTDR